MGIAKWLMFLSVIGFLARPVLAQSNSDPIGPTAALDRLKVVAEPFNPSTDENTFISYLGYVLTVFFSMFGVIFTGLIIYAGYSWMTAAGDNTKVVRATSISRNSIFGIIVVVGAYAIWQFIFVRVVQGS